MELEQISQRSIELKHRRERNFGKNLGSAGERRCREGGNCMSH
jgi:hypothetical protein